MCQYERCQLTSVAHRALAALAALGAVSCSDPPTEPRLGAARVTIATSGLELDPDGFGVQVGMALSQDISINGTIIFTDLSAGTHNVTIDGVAGNCVVSGANPRPVDVTAADTADIAFAVTCTGTFASVSAGGAHTCAITNEGFVYCWGSNGGRLGIGTTAGPEMCLYDNPCSTQPLPLQSDLSFAAVAAGNSHTCGLTTSGMAYCWGSNAYGQLGDGTTTDRANPVVVGGQALVAVDVGTFHTCGITAGGVAYCWGDNSYGQLGDGTRNNRLAPTLVAGGLSFATVSAGGQHTCAVTADGAAYCWGDDTNGQLGGGTSAFGPCPYYNMCSTTPAPVAGGLEFLGASAGGFHTCGITPSGAAHCWGDDWLGQLGDGYGGRDSCPPSNAECSRAPVAVAGGLSFAAISAGEYRHTCGIAAGGAAYCWGDNTGGSIAGSDVRHVGPANVLGGHSFATLDAGQYFNCGLTVEGIALCWGLNLNGQLGDRSTTHRSMPAKVFGQP